VGVEPATS